jgi:RNA recognition motif-containing protein
VFIFLPGIYGKYREKMGIRLYIANLSQETTQQDLQTMFSEAGTVSLVEVVMNQKTGNSRGFAFVTMNSQEEAEKAVYMFNEKDFQGNLVRVNITLPREEQPALSTNSHSTTSTTAE